VTIITSDGNEIDTPPAECFQIDPEGKNVIIVYYPENTHPERLEIIKDGIQQIQEGLDRWVKDTDTPIFFLVLPWDIRIKVRRVSGEDDRKELREKLAYIAHEQWAGWMKYLFSKGSFNEDGTWTMPQWAVKRWQRQMITPFAKLSEKEKESDRIEADKFLEVIYSNLD
jgi:hypothetical protein